MLTRMLTYAHRRWAYSIGEIVSISVFGFTFARLALNSSYRFGNPNDPGMAKATAACFVLLSAGTFILTNCIKKLDTGK